MSLYAFADVDFSGQVSRNYPKADPERRTFEVDVRLDHPSPRMQAGMTGELAFEMKRRLKTLVAPSQALQEGKIWVVRDGKLRATKAEVGIRGIERVEVVAGLQAGDRVVISPIAGLTDGQSVRIGQEISPLDAAAVNKPKKKELFRGGF